MVMEELGSWEDYCTHDGPRCRRCIRGIDISIHLSILAGGDFNDLRS